MYNRKALGELMRKYRADAGLRIQDVSDVTSVSVTYISETERGLRTISPGRLDQIAKFLKFSRADYVKAFTYRRRLPPDVETRVLNDPNQWQQERT